MIWRKRLALAALLLAGCGEESMVYWEQMQSAEQVCQSNGGVVAMQNIPSSLSGDTRVRCKNGAIFTFFHKDHRYAMKGKS